VKDIGARFREFARLERKRGGEGLTTPELERWTLLKRELSRHFSPGLGDKQVDQRQSLRVPTRLRVSFPKTEDLQDSLMTNLSKSGVFIHTETPAPIGTRMVLNIHVAETGQAIEVPATVVTHHLGPHLARNLHGMGMQFVDLAPEVEEQIGQLYEKALQEHARKVEAERTAKAKKSAPKP
jgi:uncharacterized protein (TIGR02266 family)